ncbi:hypothetical protein H8356DRAFT_1653238 [Neocallimastix lanati (nom. inval.)]|jgi:hypothetical protein|uniref:Uncharacterized protein n=1 Tax=Neocallimastix californiae TaxID=1754190 RepID=A0A1Y2F254_9FUNG|nr:hypothetical protein H8356DRAFT_1653238 [Neocallimastix sp. JGI-2020a]ORY77933.1 hypothetical protein LY90DRAFT_698454 [Neocallimastix californiae]|eukprot:ORY77933.1 hypothetical protein LY90DRAFT_698454 [Neocallimastix californiae]
MFKLPTYDQIMNTKEEENNDALYRGNVKLITPTMTYEIPRINFIKVKESEFGIAFIKEKKDEMEWSHNDKYVEEFVVNLLKNKGTNFQFKFPKGTIEEKEYILQELKKLHMKEYFESTALGINWKRLLSLHSYYKDVLSNDFLCNKLSEIWIRAFNKALELYIYAGNFEITYNGKIALNNKDITKDVLSLNGKNEDFIDDSNLLINFCLYCDINKYWDKVYQGIVVMLCSQNESYPWQKNILMKGEVCNNNNNNCCFQSTYHRHFKFNLVDYLNHLMP